MRLSRGRRPATRWRFRQLVERHQRRAFAIALGLVRDENDARELVQDAFLRVFKSLPPFQGSSSFFTWLYRIITNLGIDLIRKPGRQTTDLRERRGSSSMSSADLDLPFLSRFDGSDPADVVRRREIAGRLRAALDALPSYHRAVILMREIDGLSYEEMAQAMGVSKGTIMSRLFHARQKLQRALAETYREQIGPRPSGEVPAPATEGASREPLAGDHARAHGLRRRRARRRRPARVEASWPRAPRRRRWWRRCSRRPSARFSRGSWTRTRRRPMASPTPSWRVSRAARSGRRIGRRRRAAVGRTARRAGRVQIVFAVATAGLALAAGIALYLRWRAGSGETQAPVASVESPSVDMQAAPGGPRRRGSRWTT